jgi:hypothetical protein
VDEAASEVVEVEVEAVDMEEAQAAQVQDTIDLFSLGATVGAHMTPQTTKRVHSASASTISTSIATRRIGIHRRISRENNPAGRPADFVPSVSSDMNTRKESSASTWNQARAEPLISAKRQRRRKLRRMSAVHLPRSSRNRRTTTQLCQMLFHMRMTTTSFRSIMSVCARLRV